MTEQYGDILIRVGEWNEQEKAYRVEATVDDGSFFDGGQLRFDGAEVLAAEQNNEKYGREWFDALLTESIRRAYNVARGRAQVQSNNRLRVRLWIDQDAPELHAVPWERIYHFHDGHFIPLAATLHTPFSRYTRLEQAEPTPISERPIRMLVVIANPKDVTERFGLVRVPVEQELENLRLALRDVAQRRQQQAGEVEITLMIGQTELTGDVRDNLIKEGYKLVSGNSTLDNIFDHMNGQHIFHFIGHGSFRRNQVRGAGRAFLYLEDENGNTKPCQDEDFVAKLKVLDAAAKPSLIFLSACESAKRDQEHPFVGLAPQLVQTGIPAVIAMQDLVPITTAQQFTRSFYNGLLEHGVVDQAVNEARATLFKNDGQEWAIPVLFSRLTGGQLFVGNPILTALRGVFDVPDFRPWELKGYLPLPQDAIHLTGDQDPNSISVSGENMAPSQDLVEAALNIFRRTDETPEDELTFVLLLGSHGMSKSTQMHRLVGLTAGNSLKVKANERVIPVYVDLTRFPQYQNLPGNPVEQLMLESLQPYWPQLTLEKFREALASTQDVKFRVFLDGSDDIPEQERWRAWRAIRLIAERYPRHQYMLAVDPANLERRRLPVTDMLILQPFTERKIRSFLERFTDAAGLKLHQALQKTQLFDLAAVPWLFVKLFQRAQMNDYPKARGLVLRSLMDDALSSIPTRQGLRARAETTICTLGWEMQASRKKLWSLDDTFAVLARVRGSREYALEDMLEALIQAGVLARVGQESVRFAYPMFQTYAAAVCLSGQPNYEEAIENITATLGRRSHLRWWQETLIVLAGLMSDPQGLIQKMVLGVLLTDAEQAFLAARCLWEIENRRVDNEVMYRLMSALNWHTNSVNEPRSGQRLRAVQVLGTVRHAAFLPHAAQQLVRIIQDKTRVNWKGEVDYELSRVRMAAATSLNTLLPQIKGDVPGLDEPMRQLYRDWQAADAAAVERLIARTRHMDALIRALAVYALGDLHTKESIEELIRLFMDPQLDSATRWAVTDAMTRLSPTTIIFRVIMPLIDEDMASLVNVPQDIWDRREEWYACIAYLIGTLEEQDPALIEFLGRCLHDISGYWVTIHAIQSIGALYVRQHKTTLENIALGDFEGLKLGKRLNQNEHQHLRVKAMEALANVGDQESLQRLQASRTEWNPELEQAFFRTSEEIYWRLNLSMY